MTDATHEVASISPRLRVVRGAGGEFYRFAESDRRHARFHIFPASGFVPAAIRREIKRSYVREQRINAFC